ncbi:PepSY domain-containing protein [Halovulum sp. GXIMD14793]
MRKVILYTFALGLLTAGSVPAQGLRELNHTDLRNAVQAGQLIKVSTAMASANRVVSGKALDVRAFAARGVYYQVLMMRNDGKVVSVVVDARTGNLVSASSDAAKAVRAAATQSRKSGGPNHVPRNRNGSGKGNSNSNGNGGGNGSGNSGGNGNGGGNAGGNGSGNGNGGDNSGGNGNGGGNGGGNSGGNGNGGGNGGGRK